MWPWKPLFICRGLNCIIYFGNPREVFMQNALSVYSGNMCQLWWPPPAPGSCPVWQVSGNFLVLQQGQMIKQHGKEWGLESQCLVIYHHISMSNLAFMDKWRLRKRGANWKSLIRVQRDTVRMELHLLTQIGLKSNLSGLLKKASSGLCLGAEYFNKKHFQFFELKQWRFANL